jgi:hypothetical protein
METGEFNAYNVWARQTLKKSLRDFVNLTANFVIPGLIRNNKNETALIMLSGELWAC